MTDLFAADRAARHAAQRVFDRPLVLEAGAGTGKTLTLVARLLAWCLGPGWERAAERQAAVPPPAAEVSSPERDDERIAAAALGRAVAITFTEAAAAELATRTAGELAGLAAGIVPAWLWADALPASELVTRRARALLGTLDHLIVRTVHAFCLRLLAAFPLEAGVDPALEVDATGERRIAVVREAVETMLREGYGDPGGPDHLALAAAGYGPPEIETALSELLIAGLPAAALAEDPFGAGARGAFVERLTTAAGALLELIAGRMERAPNGKKIESGLTALLGRLESAAGLAELRQVLDAALPDNLRNHLGKWAKGSFNNAECAGCGDSLSELSSMAQELAGMLETLAALDPETLGRAHRVLGPLAQTVESELAHRGIATFDELLHSTEQLLATHPEVRAQVRGAIDQLLVDEFQDTDRVQCEILRWIALDGRTEQRPGLFLVGDPKQSIYGWRNADLASYEGFLGAVREAGGEIVTLSVNFRSVPAILEEVRRSIEPVMRPQAGLQPRFEPLLPCPARAEQAGFERPPRRPLEFWVSWSERDGGRGDANSALEAEAIARDLRELHDREGVPWREMALLLRGMNDVDTYLQALRHLDVPFAVGRDKQYYRRREIIDAAAIVRTLLDPGDQLALLTTLRSPAVGVPDAALVPLWRLHLPARLLELHGPDPERLDHLAALVHRAAAAMPAEVPGLERVHGWELSLIAAIEHIAALRLAFTTEPADLFLERVRELFLLEPIAAARYLGRYRLANLDRFFRQLLLAFEDGGDSTAVLRTLRSGVAAAPDAEEQRPEEGFGDAVAVLTIHGAKGLEFDHVYLPQMGKQAAPNDATRTTAGQAPDGRWEYRVFGTPTLGFDRIERSRVRVEATERVRLLYVAMTRARQRLVVCGAWKAAPAGEPVDPEKARSALDLLAARQERPDLDEQWDEAVAGGAAGRTDTTGALWRMLAFAARESHPLVFATGQSVDPAEVDSGAQGAELAAFQASAAARMRRSFGGPASAEAHSLLEEESEELDRRPVGRPRDGREIALAAGAAVHRALEAWDLAADPEQEAERQRRLLPAYVRDAALPGAPARAQRARERAEGLLAGFAQSELLGRFRALAQHVVARELPVLLAPDPAAGGPVGFISGTVDLLYRDPRSGLLVIADYKTDEVTEPAELEARTAIYAPQGALYARALTVALGLAAPPRFELWFLRAGAVRTVALAAAERAAG